MQQNYENLYDIEKACFWPTKSRGRRWVAIIDFYNIVASSSVSSCIEWSES